MNKRTYFAVVLAFVAQSAVAGGLGKPIIHEETSSWESEFWWVCADEALRLEEHATFRTHEFQTSTGTFHFVGSMLMTSLAEGVTTGRKWVGETRLLIRDQIKLGTGETYGLNVRQVFRPVDGDGPTFALYNQYVVRLDADGNVIMENEKGHSLDGKCLGPAK